MAFNPIPDIPQPVQLSQMDGTFSQPGVYFLWQGESVVYVGQTRQMDRRITEHMVEGKKTFDGISCKPCDLRQLTKVERFYIETLLPKYNRCPFSEGIRRIWVGHTEDRPLPDRRVGPDLAAKILGVTVPQLRALHDHGLPFRNMRIPRMRARRLSYSVRDIHQFTAQKASAIIAVRQQFPA